MTKFLSEKGKIADTFKTVESKVSLTTDAWTSSNTKGILWVTWHWVDKNYELKELIMDAVELKEPHTGVNLACNIVTP